VGDTPSPIAKLDIEAVHAPHVLIPYRWHLDDLPLNQLNPNIVAEDTRVDELHILLNREHVRTWLLRD
jgi:hypothetical protein